MSSTSQRLIDAEGAGDVSVHGPLHGLFRGKGAPNNLARSFSSIWALGLSNTNDLELIKTRSKWLKILLWALLRI